MFIERLKNTLRHPDIGGKLKGVKEKCVEIGHNLGSRIGEGQMRLIPATASPAIPLGSARYLPAERKTPVLSISVRTDHILHREPQRTGVAPLETGEIPIPLDPATSHTYSEKQTPLKIIINTTRILHTTPKNAVIDKPKIVVEEATATKTRTKQSEALEPATEKPAETQKPRSALEQMEKIADDYQGALNRAKTMKIESEGLEIPDEELRLILQQEAIEIAKEAENDMDKRRVWYEFKSKSGALDRLVVNTATKAPTYIRFLHEHKTAIRISMVAGAVVLAIFGDGHSLQNVGAIIDNAPHVIDSLPHILDGFGNLQDAIGKLPHVLDGLQQLNLDHFIGDHFGGSDVTASHFDASAQPDPTAAGFNGHETVITQAPTPDYGFNPADNLGPTDHFSFATDTPSLEPVDITPTQHIEPSVVNTPVDTLPDITNNLPDLTHLRFGEAMDPQIREIASNLPGDFNENFQRTYQAVFVEYKERFDISAQFMVNNPNLFSTHLDSLAQLQQAASSQVDQQIKSGIRPDIGLIQDAIRFSSSALF